MRTDDIASGGGGDRLPEREPAAEQRAPAQEGAAPGGDPGGGGGPGPASGKGWQPQSPDPQGQREGVPAGGAEQGGAPTGQRTEAATAPGGGGAVTEGATASGAGGGATEGGAAQAGGGTATEAATGPGGAATEERGAPGGAGGGARPTGVGGPGGGPTDGQTTGGAATQSAVPGGEAQSPESTPLLSGEDASDFERRWQDVQVGFVDEPQRCVQEADGLVAEVMQRLADGFAQERKDLESQWAGGGEPSTEDLRVALQRYRSFFNRLLKTT